MQQIADYSEYFKNTEEIVSANINQNIGEITMKTITDEEIENFWKRFNPISVHKFKEIVLQIEKITSSKKDAEWELRANKKVFEAKILKNLKIKELNNLIEGLKKMEQTHKELETLSLELAELSMQYSNKYNRFNQLLAKWKKNLKVKKDFN